MKQQAKITHFRVGTLQSLYARAPKNLVDALIIITATWYRVNHVDYYDFERSL